MLYSEPFWEFNFLRKVADNRTEGRKQGGLFVSLQKSEIYGT